MQSTKAHGYFFTEAGSPLEKKEFTIDGVGDDDVIVKVAGCGLCHTDLGFMSGNVRTNAELPLILGHEISGEVVAAGPSFDALVGKNVIIPAVLPCGECDLCKSGRSNICRQQKMPGNDFNGGFASHITVPGRFLCRLPDDTGGFKVSQLSVIADAVTTPYQSLQRSNLKKGDLAVVIGVGGIGIYMAQLAKDAGASVIAIDIDDSKLDKAVKLGADFSINAKDLSEKDIKGNVRTIVKENKLPKYGWKIFETSGTAAGQNSAFSLLSFAGVVGIVGFTMDKVQVRLSNVMAFDADLFGNWGCMPEHYPAVVEKVLKGSINLLDNIEEHPLDSINEIVPLAFEHKLEKRVIFVP
ncbi:MAG: 6-hydroxycyclohex-1-ene-1-carbonyl-CoA dehydrogenase [bacterium]|nr:MAG: 6-hydroxycyclohex-1-ene-1-carbonyl-CoA dehydrogenase [bacterium]